MKHLKRKLCWYHKDVTLNLLRELCEIKCAHILSLWDNLKIAAPPPLTQFWKKYANVPRNFEINFCTIYSLTKALHSWCLDLQYSYPPQSKKIWTPTVYFIQETQPTMAIPDIMSLGKTRRWCDKIPNFQNCDFTKKIKNKSQIKKQVSNEINKNNRTALYDSLG